MKYKLRISCEIQTIDDDGNPQGDPLVIAQEAGYLGTALEATLDGRFAELAEILNR